MPGHLRMQHVLPSVFRRLEQGKFNNDLAHLSERVVALLRAIAQSSQEESNPAPFAQKSPHIFSSGWRTRVYSLEPGEVATSFITRYFDNSCSSRNEQHGEEHQASNAQKLQQQHPNRCRAAGPAQRQPTGRTPFPCPFPL